MNNRTLEQEAEIAGIVAPLTTEIKLLKGKVLQLLQKVQELECNKAARKEQS